MDIQQRKQRASLQRRLLKDITHNIFEEAKTSRQARISSLCLANRELFVKSMGTASVSPSFIFSGKFYTAYHWNSREKSIGGVKYDRILRQLHPSLFDDVDDVLRVSFQDTGNELKVSNYIGQCIAWMEHASDLFMLGIPDSSVPSWTTDKNMTEFYPETSRTDADCTAFIAANKEGYLAVKRLFLYNIITNK